MENFESKKNLMIKKKNDFVTNVLLWKFLSR